MKSKIFNLLFLFLFLGGFLASAVPVQAQQETNLYFFWGFGCPHCAKEKEFLSELSVKYPELKIKRFEVYFSKKNQQLLEKIVEELKIESLGVPLTIVGDEVFVGFSEGINDNLIQERVEECLASGCPDETASLIESSVLPSGPVPNSTFPAEEGTAEKEPATTTSTTSPVVVAASSSPLDNLKLPIFGSLDLSGYSLPALAVILGVLDGFNPCAMWALLFLISLLLGMENRRRMWLLGSAFIITSAAVYFIFMAAWLNLIIFLGFVLWIRLLIGLVAVSGGGYNLWEFFKNRSGTCKISESPNQAGTLKKLKRAVQERNLWLALGGIIALAFAVNLVELVCSAGLPAVFTQVLVLNNLSSWRYYLYILLYIFFFMLDDLVVFFVSMVTLRLTGVTTKYSKASRLVGGVLMVVIGLLLIFKPEWLLFG
jgi:glutaredoxin/cytochrome c biogenesis protein CcdA